MQAKDPKPEILRLEEVALMVKSGEIKLPKFQRPFVWKSSDMLKLLDSIYKGYPIGSILIWNSSQKLISERSISGFEVNSNQQNSYPTNYLLDGQQRLTTLCGALFWNGLEKDSIWNIQFDLDSQEFKHPREANLINVFPLNKLIQTSDFIRQCMKFDHHEKREEYFRIAERLLKSIKDYKIAVVKIGDMTIEEVAPIFERINSTGRQLTIVDLMMAATWSDGFDLNTEIQRIRECCEGIGFDAINDQIILRTISAAAELGVNKDDIQKLRSKTHLELHDASSKAQASLEKALRFLRDKVGVYSFSYIPYALQLTYIAEFFRISEEPSAEQIECLTQWFWYTSVTRYFGTYSSTGQVTKDLLLFRNFARGRTSRLFEYKELDISRMLYDKFNLGTAASTVFALLLNDADPHFTLDGQLLDNSHRKLKLNTQFATFCPKDGVVEKLNISKVIHPFGQIAEGFETIFELREVEKHLLDQQCVEFKQNDDVRGFVDQRSTLLAARIHILTGCDIRYQPPAVFATGDDISVLDEDE